MKKITTLKNKTKFSNNQLIVFILVFAALGGYLLYRSFAAGPVVASLEAEQMVLPSGGTVVTDTTASAGKAILLASNGTATGRVNFPSSVTSLTVSARGAACQGSPTMNVAIDGNNVLTNTSVSSSNWAAYSANTNLNSGTHSLAISFTNDNSYSKRHGHTTTTCSRDLYVDVTNFYGPTVVTPAPTVALAASPTSLTAGAASTLTWNSTNATSCTASGAWSGINWPTSGSQSTGALNQTSTYTLTCTGAGGTVSGSVAVTVSAGTGSGPSGYNWIGDFRNGPGDLSQFQASDLSDANLSMTITDPTFGSTYGTTIQSKPVPNYPSSQYSARIVASNGFSSTSASGAATVLWMKGDYSNAWTQRGAKTWFRYQFLIPDGTDPNYPGKLVPLNGDGLGATWHVMEEWHIDNGTLTAHGGFTSSSSTAIEIGWGGATSKPALLLRPVGGLYGQTKTSYFYETDQVQNSSNGPGGGSSLGPVAGNIIPLQYNHWYDILVYQVFDPDPSVGYIQWWVDGVKRFDGNFPTLTGAQDGYVPGVGFEGGLYRGTYATTNVFNETIYQGPMIAGPTRASVGD